MLEIEYEFREQDLIHFNEMLYKKSPEIQKKVRNSRWILPGILILVGLFYLSYLGDEMTALYIIILSLGMAITSPMVMRWSFRNQILSKYTDKEKHHMFGQYKLIIEPQMLIESSPSGKHKMLWKDLLRVEYGDKYVYIYIEIDTALIIPVETVTSGDLEAFAEKAEQMIDKLE